jgi:branched-chain amino acid aminotransferase
MLAVFPSQEHAIPPANMGLSTIRRNEYSPLANIKSLAYLDSILARREMVKRGFNEAILLNTQGNVASCSAANIFIVTKDNRLITPHIKDGVLPGITREIVLALAAEHHLTIEERSIHPDELFTAKEVFITNSIIEIQAVKQIHEKVFDCDENHITRTLQAAYKASIAECIVEPKHLSSCKR